MFEEYNSKLFDEKAIQQQMNEELVEKVIKHRNAFHSFMQRRYNELIPLAISYRNNTPDNVRVDFLHMEVLLYNGYDVVVGMCKDKTIRLIGYVTKKAGYEKPAFFYQNVIQPEDITYLISKDLIDEDMTQLTHENEKGTFVVIQNKVLNYTSDIEIVKHYLNELSEIKASRYSLIIQSKVLTFFIDYEDSEDMNKVYSRLYNGGGSITVSPHFDPEESIYTMNNATLSQNLVELKSEYQNIITELNNALGINSLAMEKQSGVSDTEAKSNTAYTTLNANLKLKTRLDGFQLLNKRFDVSIAPFYDDVVISQLMINERRED